jgi:hypothetical protein
LTTWKGILDSAIGIYDKLNQETIKAKGGNSGKIGKTELNLTAWNKLVWALGGEKRIRELEDRME